MIDLAATLEAFLPQQAALAIAVLWQRMETSQ
jgi:hypothetical protein